MTVEIHHVTAQTLGQGVTPRGHTQRSGVIGSCWRSSANRAAAESTKTEMDSHFEKYWYKRQTNDNNNRNNETRVGDDAIGQVAVNINTTPVYD